MNKLTKLSALLLVMLITACGGVTGTGTSSSVYDDSSRYRQPEIEDTYVEPVAPDGSVFVQDGRFRRFRAAGFAEMVTGGGNIPDTDPGYAKVTTADEFITAALDNDIRVIEIMEDLYMGYNEIGDTYRNNSYRNIVKKHNEPLMHPKLKQTGVVRFIFENRQNLTIFSTFGATVYHAGWDFRSCKNIMIRNIGFDEMWEWDEATRGNEDINDWDFLTFDINNFQMWVDHCDFGKAYDGVVDVKQGPNQVTFSYIRTKEIDYGPGSFLYEQMEYLEDRYQAALAAKTPDMGIQRYTFLRSEALMPMEDIAQIMAPNKKIHLFGSNENILRYKEINVTMHHNLYLHTQDRLPRLRRGNTNIYNIVADSTKTMEAKLLCEQYETSNPAGYKICPTSQALISAEDGALYVEKSVFKSINILVRNNQKDETDIFTGKILVEDSIYTTPIRDNGENLEYYFRGSSDDVSSPFAPYNTYGALEKPWSWNGGTWEGVEWDDSTGLPFSISNTRDNNTDHLEKILTSPYTGAGAGILNWHKSYWLVSSY